MKNFASAIITVQSKSAGVSGRPSIPKMTKTEEKKLEKFLKETFGSRWEFTWKGEEDGFSLSLDVWRTDSFEKAVIEANKT